MMKKVKGSESMRQYDKWKAEQLKKQKDNLYFQYWFAAFDGFIFEAFKAGELSGISRTANTIEKINKPSPLEHSDDGGKNHG